MEVINNLFYKSVESWLWLVFYSNNTIIFSWGFSFSVNQILYNISQGGKQLKMERNIF